MENLQKMRTQINTNSDVRYFIIKISTDLSAILFLGIPVLLLDLIGKPYNRGFNCDDESIRYPYRDNTITSTVLYLYSTIIPAVTITIIEYGWYMRAKDTTRTAIPLTHFLWQIYLRIIPFAFGALLSQLTTDIAKYSIGRLRPHFIDVCKPQVVNQFDKPFTLDLDMAHYCVQNAPLVYWTDYVCTNTKYNEKQHRDAHLSFMSGHSSFSTYCLLYLVIYIQKRLKWSTVGYIKPLYQGCCLYLAFYTGLSRISDYKHHWSDVLTGTLNGVIVSILASYFISDLFVKNGVHRYNGTIDTNRGSHYNDIESRSVSLNGSTAAAAIPLATQGQQRYNTTIETSN